MSEKEGNYWKVPASHVRQFEAEISKDGGIDYAKLCLECLTDKQRRSIKLQLKAKQTTTAEVSRRWRTSSTVK